MSPPFGQSLPNEIVLPRDGAATVLFALDETVEAATDDERRHRFRDAASMDYKVNQFAMVTLLNTRTMSAGASPPQGRRSPAAANLSGPPRGPR